MRRDGWQGDPVDVVNMPDGAPTSMDNRRLLAAREAGIPIEANVRNASDPLTPAQVDRFETNGGLGGNAKRSYSEWWRKQPSTSLDRWGRASLMPNSPMSSSVAYLAMFSFLEDYYNRTKSDEIGSMLSGLCLMSDGKPMDPAYWSEWEEAVRKAINGEVDAEMRLTGGSDHSPPSSASSS